MLTTEEKQELEELRLKDNLSTEEKSRLAELEEKEPVVKEEQEFDTAWEELEKDTGDSPSGSENSDTGSDPSQDKDSKDSDPSDNTGTKDKKKKSQQKDSDPDSDSLFNDLPDSSSDDSQAQDGDGESGQDIDWQKRFDQLQDEHQKVIQKMRSWEGRIKAANQRADIAEQKLKQGQDKDATDGDLPEETDDAALSEFISEFPEMEKPIKAMAKRVAQTIVDERLGKVETTVSTVQETVEQVREEKHFTEIEKVHPDWKQIVTSGALAKWIDIQPDFIQEALHNVVKNGSTKEAIDLLNQYKRSVRPQTSNSSDSSKDKSKKVQAMQAVAAQSGGPKETKKIDKNDFDAAWDYEIAKEEKQRR